MSGTASIVLPYSVAIALVAGLALSVVYRRPPRCLFPVLLNYQLFVLLYIVGDMLTRLSQDLWVEQLGIALIYSGSIPAAAACWILTLRYAEAQGRPFPWARGWWVQGPIVASALAWTAAITNPLHGQFLTPVIGAHNEHHWMWWTFVPVGYGLVAGSLLLYGLLAATAADRLVRRNALLMAGGLAVSFLSNFFSYITKFSFPVDPNVIGVGTTSGILLYGAYRTQLFSLLPPAVVEASRADPSARILIDLEGGWLRSNAAAVKLVGSDLSQPGRDVMALLARRLRGADRERLGRDDLAQVLLHAAAAGPQVLGPLCAGDAHWVEIAATPVPESEGRPQAISLRVEDISARMAVEEQLRRARQELFNQVGERRQVDALLGELLRDAARVTSEADDPAQVVRLALRIERAASRARQFTGAVVPKR